MSASLLTGMGVALISVSREDGSLDAQATAKLAERLVELGMSAVIVAGSTGEAKSLSVQDRDELLFAIRSVIPGDSGIALIAGTGGNSADEAVNRTRRARQPGADGFLVLSPPGSYDLLGYYRAVVDVAESNPVLACHFPVVSSPGIGVEQLAGLPVVGLKDSSGDPERLLLTRFSWREPPFTGSSAMLTMAGRIGCAGAILALANVMPELSVAAFAGDGNAQIQLVQNHLAVNSGFPSRIKELTGERFGTSTVTRVCR